MVLVDALGRVHRIEMVHEGVSAAKKKRRAGRLALRRGRQVRRERRPEKQ
jgi:hypothetical protein